LSGPLCKNTLSVNEEKSLLRSRRHAADNAPEGRLASRWHDDLWQLLDVVD
jgi:hypothetical protein